MQPINPYIAEQQLSAFAGFVRDMSGVAFVSFESNPYVLATEGYKYEIYVLGRKALSIETWKPSYIGTGRITRAVIAAIEIPGNNLVMWQARYGDQRRPHQALYEALGEPTKLRSIETTLYTLYRQERDEQCFEELISFVGRKYPLIGYLLFLKDRSRYLPIAPTTFGEAFRLLGSDFTTSQQCSWHNYRTYTGLIGEVRETLSLALATEVTLLDAHSFVWMLARQMKKADRLADIQDYLALSASEREAIVKARIGQGRFREDLVLYWGRVCGNRLHRNRTPASLAHKAMEVRNAAGTLVRL